jgi:hypothetical protein
VQEWVAEHPEWQVVFHGFLLEPELHPIAAEIGYVALLGERLAKGWP